MARAGVGASGALFVADANVLIDYRNAGLAHLGRFAGHVGPVFVLRALLRDEVKGLSLVRCRKAGLTLVDAPVEVVLDASKKASGSLLSFYDWLCLLEAKRRGAACLTSDCALLRACQKEGIATRRGLAPLVDLVGLGRLSARQALAVARRMAETNPYLKEAMPEFEREVAGRARKKGESATS